MPGPYDGFLVELEGGGFKVEAHGAVVKAREPDLDRARAVLDEHAAGKPKWYVGRDGEVTRI